MLGVTKTDEKTPRIYHPATEEERREGLQTLPEAGGRWKTDARWGEEERENFFHLL